MIRRLVSTFCGVGLAVAWVRLIRMLRLVLMMVLNGVLVVRRLVAVWRILF